MNDGLNYETWARNAVAFIRERGLEGEFSDWCGGWPIPVKATAPMIAAAPDMLSALERIRDAGLGGYLTPELCADIVTKAIERAHATTSSPPEGRAATQDSRPVDTHD